jgi:hypothetical protein
MKRVIIAISILIFSTTSLFSQSFGGVRALRTQATFGFQNGAGLDVEYLTPLGPNRLAVRAGYSILPMPAGELEFAGLNSDLELSASTFDFGVKYYVSGPTQGLFLGVDVAFDNKNVLLSNINGTTNELKIGDDEAPDGTEVNNGTIDETISSMMITPKLGWTKVSKTGFTWSFELGYSLINVDPLNATLLDGTNEYTYEFNNIYDDLFGMTGLPYVRLGFGYSFKLTKNTY